MTVSVNKFHICKFLRNIILISLALLQFSCGEKVEIHISKTIMFEGKLYETSAENPFSGIVYNTYPNNLREYEGEYINGKPNGLLTYWYNNGKKMREGKLKDGIPVGTWTTYKDDGSIQQSIEY